MQFGLPISPQALLKESDNETILKNFHDSYVIWRHTQEL